MEEIFLGFFTDSKQHQAQEFELITLRNHAYFR